MAEEPLIHREELTATLFAISDIQCDVRGILGILRGKKTVAKSRRLTADDLAAHAERSRRFRELLVRRQARDEELKAAREKAEPRRRR